MDKLDQQGLYKLLDIEKPEDFEYFENIADLLEYEEEIDETALFQLVKDLNKDTLAELLFSYFEEIMDFIPDDALELYTFPQMVFGRQPSVMHILQRRRGRPGSA